MGKRPDILDFLANINSNKIGVVWEINEIYKKIMIICISKDFFNYVIYENISIIPFKPQLHDLIFIDDSETKGLIKKRKFLKFDFSKHFNLIDILCIQRTSHFKLANNLNFKDILIKNKIYENEINIQNYNGKANNFKNKINKKLYCGVCVNIYTPNNSFKLKSLVNDSYGEIIKFNLHEVPFKIKQGEIIVIDCRNLTNRCGIPEYTRFSVNLHSNMLDFVKIKKTDYINIEINRENALFFIQNKIATGDLLINEISSLETRLVNAKNNLDSLINYKTIEQISLEYVIKYEAWAKTKIGDWGHGHLKIITTKPNLYDIYLEELFPIYEKVIDEESEGIDTPFSHSIISKMENRLGNQEVERLKKLCINATNNIRDLAIFMYDKYKHLSSLEKYKKELEIKLIDKYK